MNCTCDSKKKKHYIRYVFDNVTNVLSVAKKMVEIVIVMWLKIMKVL